MDAETMELVCANRSFLWSLVARAYAEEADEAFLEVLQSDHARAEIGLLSDSWTESMIAAYAKICDRLDGEGTLTAVRHEYVNIFIGPATLKASPWESVHRTNKQVLFQSGVLEVREAYRQAGFLPSRYPHVADDFIGIECDFMAKLAKSALDFWAKNDETMMREQLGHSLQFLNSHLGIWIQSLAHAIREYYGDCFYARFTDLLVQLVRRDEGLLGSL